jgi:molybdopterin molybdotransferase
MDLEWREARSVARGVRGPLGTERVALAGAQGRILARPVRALAASPGFDTAAMDGYAVCGDGPWRIVGRVLAGGESWAGVLAPGAAVEIATGARVPAGARAVLPYECCHVDGALVAGVLGGRDHIRRVGEDALVGEELAPAGRRVDAAVLGVAAQGGVDVVQVYRQPRVCVLVTGDEVVSHGIPGPGQVRDALGPVVQAIVRRAGAVVIEQRVLADDGDVLRAAIEDAAAAEVVVVTGSSSAGAADHLHGALERLGARWWVDGVACRPGHPQALASLGDGRWVVGLPGNPFAGLVAALTLLDPLLGALTGRAPATALVLPVFGAAAVYPAGVRLVPVSIEGAQARVIPGARAASLRAAALADAVAVIEPHWTDGGPAELLSMP